MNDVREQFQRFLSLLTRREEKVIRLRFGFGDGTPRSYEEIAEIFAVSVAHVAAIDQAAWSKLQKYVNTDLLDALVAQSQAHQPSAAEIANFQHVIEKVERLTPELMIWLRENGISLDEVRWDVFEHVVGELLAQQGFKNVRLVGRDNQTGADIFAMHQVDATGLQFNVFVEVKHREGKLGVEVIDKVYGAMIRERPRYGWHAAIIVSSGHFQNFKRDSRRDLRLQGIELRDKIDFTRWLENYELHDGGLWLPNPKRTMRD